ncbi:MAG: 5-guanidino-2-oxopentanoate decarboxylase [Parasphingorhabdus sp.]|jgi:5-guanidino-2-oxopentanoate decarboxylase
MNKGQTCGEATIKLLEAYGVDTVFGIPGVHTLEFCRGLANSPIQHVQARNEQGAGFMADGYARMSGKPGVALVISGPGVTNAATPLGQSYADSIPVLLLSSEPHSDSHGKGWGVLHEVTEQKATTEPLTALSATAYKPADVPDLLAQAFSLFSSQRPRPVHISIPIDVLAQNVEEQWQAVRLPGRAGPTEEMVTAAVELLDAANRPMILVGGGATDAADSLTNLAEKLAAPVISSTAGKGIVPDSHGLSLSGGTVRTEVQKYLSSADVVLAIGTELSETDSFVDLLDIQGKLIRVDIDPRKINDCYPADIGIVGDAAVTASLLLQSIADTDNSKRNIEAQGEVAELHLVMHENLTSSEQQHTRLLKQIRKTVAEDTIFAGDVCQIVYTGAFAMSVDQPRLWHYPAGYCTLGCGLPNGIGAKLALPDRPVMVLAGDGGFMFTVQELVCAAELKMPLPIVLWENGGLKQIQDDMKARDIPLVGVEGINPDFELLAKACRCLSAAPSSMEEFSEVLVKAFSADVPTLILVNENSDWLL